MAKFDSDHSSRKETIVAAEFALNSTCQLYQWQNEDKNIFVANGCTILFQHNGHHYCFSNAHVLADTHLSETFFLLKDGTTMTVGGDHWFTQPISSENRNDDNLDVAIVKLNPSVANHLLNNGQQFLTLENVRTLPGLSKGDILLLAGYPASKTKVDLETMRLKFNPLVARTVPYVRKFYNKSFTGGFHHLVEYRVKSFKEASTGQRMRGPRPHGISGSGLWLLPGLNNVSVKPVLIGILSEYHENSAVIVSTKIDLFLDLTRRRFDNSIQHDGIKIEIDWSL